MRCAQSGQTDFKRAESTLVLSALVCIAAKREGKGKRGPQARSS